MEKHIKVLWWIMICIFSLTALLTLGGVCYIWFIKPGEELVFLDTLFTALIIETIGVCFAVVKGTVGGLPKVKNYSKAEDINEFLAEFALRGSSVEFVSNRASWLASDQELKQKLADKANRGCSVSVLTTIKPNQVEVLEESGVKFICNKNNNYVPNARFTLINSSRQGAEELAIAVGTFPAHTVYVFNAKNSPHIIAMAKDIVNLMKENEECKNNE